MQEQDREPVGTICLLAALADGVRSAEEQAQLARIATRLGITLPAEPRDTVGDLAARLSTREVRQRTYEMAASVVYADGEANAREQAFLQGLREALALDDSAVGSLDRDALSLAEAPLGVAPAADTSGDKGIPKGLFASQGGIPTINPDAALDSLIKKQAMLTGALEILPQQIATLAIIPLQMRLVYRIGADFGHHLDSAQIRDLLGAMGIGAAAQVLDGMSRRIIGGLGRGILGSVLGGIVGGTAAVAAGAGLSFVTTYALGHAAKQYYAQGRKLSREDLATLYRKFRSDAEQILPSLQEQIHQQSQHMDLPKLLASIRGPMA